MSYLEPTPRIGITVTSADDANVYSDIVRKHGGEPWPIFPNHKMTPEETLRYLDGLILGSGEDINPKSYGGRSTHKLPLTINTARDAVEFQILRAALTADVSTLGICRGMHVINVVLGGTLTQATADHGQHLEDGKITSNYHRIFISPGSKLATIVGSGGFVRVNSRHKQAIREAHKSSMLIASAYSMEDGIIEALESPSHRWVIGVQFQPELRKELPPLFDRLFDNLIKWAGYRASDLRHKLLT